MVRGRSTREYAAEQDEPESGPRSIDIGEPLTLHETSGYGNRQNGRC